MYLYHYGLKELPFTLTPNTKFFCELSAFSDALNLISSAVACGEGFMKIVGEVGTGKTLLCNKIIQLLSDKHRIIHIANPYLSAHELRLLVYNTLSETTLMEPSETAITEVINGLIKNESQFSKSLVILVDEAQALPTETLEAIRLLTNIESETKKLVQVILLGQPELDQRLARKELRQLRQRIVFSYQLRALKRDEIASYINQRLDRAIYCARPVFSNTAIRAIFKYSNGIPRVVNILCHRALLIGFGRNVNTIDEAIIRQASAETDNVDLPLNKQRLIKYGLPVLGALVLLMSSWLSL